MSWPVLKEYTCPLCGKKNKTYTIPMDDNVGGNDSELRSYSAGYDSLRFGLYTCGACGFTDYEFETGTKIPESERNAIEKHLAAIPRETIESLHSYTPNSPDRPTERSCGKAALSKYLLLLDLMKVRGVGPYRMANVSLDAAWIVDDVADYDTARFKTDLRRDALNYFEKALAAGEIPDEQEQERVKYLIGELCRWLGRFRDAIGYFSKVKSKEEWLNKQAKEQIKRARKKDSSLVKYKPISLLEM
jgi:hypothetical protein